MAMTRILVTTASKHGSTHEIGDAIAAVLESMEIEALVKDVDQVATVEDVDGVIVGSGVYAGHWLASATAFVDRFQVELQRRPVWLFSSGPLGDPARPAEDPAEVPTAMASSGALGHRLFAGRLEKTDLGFGERAIVNVVRAPYGDFRDWPEIRGWALEIAGTFTRVRANAG
jgi:menaquinone-dependent protoporphyrinogen oxidase